MPIPWPSATSCSSWTPRCCNHVPTSDGSFTDTPVYLYTSEDAGATFTGPTDANPYAGIIGTQDPSGDTIVYGGDVPSIGLISSVQTGGTIFQGVPAGSFTTATANLSLRPDRQDATYGSLGLDGTRPIASFSDSSGTIAVREWTGNGERQRRVAVDDAAHHRRRPAADRRGAKGHRAADRAEHLQRRALGPLDRPRRPLGRPAPGPHQEPRPVPDPVGRSGERDVRGRLDRRLRRIGPRAHIARRARLGARPARHAGARRRPWPAQRGGDRRRRRLRRRARRARRPDHL